MPKTSPLVRIDPVGLVRNVPLREQNYEEQADHHHPRRRRACSPSWVGGDIIPAAGGRVGFPSSAEGVGGEQLTGSEALDLLTEVLKISRTDGRMQHFFHHR